MSYAERIGALWPRHYSAETAQAHDLAAEADAEIAALREENKRLRLVIKAMPNDTPTSWLDPLLSGDNATLPRDLTQTTGRHIEALLRGVQDRLRRCARAALLQSEDGGGGRGEGAGPGETKEGSA